MPNSNGHLLGSTARNAVEAGMAQAECRAAVDYFNTELPRFCKRLGITPAQLNLPTPTLLMVVCMCLARENDTLSARIDGLETLKGSAP